MPSRAERSSPAATGSGKQVGSPLLIEPRVQVEAAEVEGELEPEHGEEALDVIGRLRDARRRPG